MGLVKLGIVLFGIHLITKRLREDRQCRGRKNHHEDPANNTLPNQKPPGYPQTYSAPSQYQTPEYRNEKQMYSDMPKEHQQITIGGHEIQMREAPAYEDVMSKGEAHECPNCGHGVKLQEKGEKGLL